MHLTLAGILARLFVAVMLLIAGYTMIVKPVINQGNEALTNVETLFNDRTVVDVDQR